MPNECPYCGAKTKAARSSEVYGGRDYGKIIMCSNWPDCDAYVGCHARTGEPKGILADGKLRKARIKVHALFDPRWKGVPDKRKARGKLYRWLAKNLEIKKDDCHIGMFNLETCKKAIEFLG